MNVREGMRRLGLVVGVLGAGAGAVGGYIKLQPLLAQRGQYERFQVLVSAPTVQKEVELLEKNLPAPGHGGTSNYYMLAALCGAEGGWKVNKNGIAAIYFKSHGCADTKPIAAGISMIETDDGEAVYRTDPPGFLSYFLILVLPVLGFVLPWGAVRVLTWVGSGFVEPRR
jgi:hypothetical protein